MTAGPASGPGPNGRATPARPPAPASAAGDEESVAHRGRRALALAAGKAAGRTVRLLGAGGGTSLPGRVARVVDRSVLAEVVAASDLTTVVVTGSNGKTTTARFASALLRAQGLPVHHNAAGANLAQGVTSVAVALADLHGRLPAGALVLEVDEGTLPTVAADLRPRVVVVTNLFRDQLDRFGEIYAVRDAIAHAVHGPAAEATLVVNADDPMTAALAQDRPGRSLTFGLDLPQSTGEITRAADTIRCLRCQADLSYRRVYLSHLGDYRCTACGAARPPLDVAVTALETTGLQQTRCVVRLPDGELEVTVPQVGVHIAYNTAAAIATLLALDLPTTHAAQALAGVAPAFGRLEPIAAGDRQVVLAFAKNPTSYNTTLQALAAAGEPRHLLAGVSNTRVDGEDFGWLWDVDFESVVPQLERVTVTGTRADELANRLRYAGLDIARTTVVPDRRQALDAAHGATPPGGRLVVLAGYTPMIELRDAMRRKGWTGRFWTA